MQKNRINHRLDGHRPSPFLVDLPDLLSQSVRPKKKPSAHFWKATRGVFIFLRRLLYVFSILALAGAAFGRAAFFRRFLRRPAKPAVQARSKAPEVEPAIVFSGEEAKPAKKTEKKKGARHRFFSLLRPAVGFAVIIAFCLLPFKLWLELSNAKTLEGRVLGIAEAAIGDVIGGGEAMKLMDFKAAAKHFQSAQAALKAAEAEISWLAGAANIINQVLPSEKTVLAEQTALLIEAGVLGTELAGHVSRTLAEISAAQGQGLADIIRRVDLYLVPIEDANRAFAGTLDRVRPEAIPADYRELVAGAKERGRLLSAGVDESIVLFKMIRQVLGFEYDTRHLLVFQNNSELRASGGFIGSYALADFNSAGIKSLEVPSGGGYDTEAGLYRLIRSPEALRLLKPRWYFWDANWWPDWETSAAKLAWFLEKSNGPTVDGVISFTPTFIERLLQISGPIKLSGNFDAEVDSTNFYPLIQSIVEDRDLYPAIPVDDAAGKPKEIIGELFNAMLEQIPERVDQDMLIGLGQLIISGLAEKHVLLYFSDPENQDIIRRLDWAGRQKDSLRDYLMVVNTNIGGGKSDRKIADTYELESLIREDGSVENVLKINRQHLAYKNEPLSGVRNVNWLRVYVPAGSVLLEAQGFIPPGEEYFKSAPDYLASDPYLAQTEERAETGADGAKVYGENNKTVFAGWLLLDPGESRTVVLRYRLPAKPDAGQVHELVVQKQPGTVNASFYYTLYPPPGAELAGENGETYRSREPFGFRSNLQKDEAVRLRINN